MHLKTQKKGVALRYSERDAAPVVIAKARGILLEKMKALAEDNNVTVYSDPDLAEALYAVNEGSEVPLELYKAVAEVIAYCYRINGRLSQG